MKKTNAFRELRLEKKKWYKNVILWYLYEKDITDAYIERKYEIPKNTISHWRTGVALPSVNVMRKIKPFINEIVAEYNLRYLEYPECDINSK